MAAQPSQTSSAAGAYALQLQNQARGTSVNWNAATLGQDTHPFLYDNFTTQVVYEPEMYVVQPVSQATGFGGVVRFEIDKTLTKVGRLAFQWTVNPLTFTAVTPGQTCSFPDWAGLYMIQNVRVLYNTKSVYDIPMTDVTEYLDIMQRKTPLERTDEAKRLGGYLTEAERVAKAQTQQTFTYYVNFPWKHPRRQLITKALPQKLIIEFQFKPLNQVVKTLTIISTIFIPLTFIVGVYGMNFDFMPELKWRYGYWLVWGFMLVLTFGMLVYFRRKSWFLRLLTRLTNFV
jgi:hypothetical protein